MPLRLASPGEIRGLDVRTVAHTDPVPGAMGVPPTSSRRSSSSRPTCRGCSPRSPLPVPDSPVALPRRHRDRRDGEPVVDAAHRSRSCTSTSRGSGFPTRERHGPGRTSRPPVTRTPPPAGACRIRKVVARLVCPRRLRSERRYVAALVPVFEQGRVAGLGGVPSATAKLTNAWSIGQSAQPVDLLLHYSWQFHTGVGGDSARWRSASRGRALPAGAGSRPLDITSPGSGLLDPPTGTTKALGLEERCSPRASHLRTGTPRSRRGSRPGSATW